MKRRVVLGRYAADTTRVLRAEFVCSKAVALATAGNAGLIAGLLETVCSTPPRRTIRTAGRVVQPSWPSEGGAMLTEQRWGEEPVDMKMTSHREFLNECLGCAETSATPSSPTRSTIPT